MICLAFLDAVIGRRALTGKKGSARHGQV